MATIAEKLTQTKNARRTPDGHFRYVCDDLKIASMGFATLQALHNHKNEIRTDPAAISLMTARYLGLIKGAAGVTENT